MNAPDGYRHEPAGGARLRADIIETYVFRLPPGAPDTIDLLQLRRAAQPLVDTWQPIIGHTEAGEHAARAALRELAEETGLRADDPAVLGVWALEQVHPFYVAAVDAVVLSPRFAVQVDPIWEPALDDEHDAHRWVTVLRRDPDSTGDRFLWPGQRLAVAEIIREIAPARSPAREHLRIEVASYWGD